jgi:hypothetical protein
VQPCGCYRVAGFVATGLPLTNAGGVSGGVAPNLARLYKAAESVVDMLVKPFPINTEIYA